jgi:hypothetical protein
VFAFSSTDDAKKIMVMKSFGGCGKDRKLIAIQKQNHHFELESNYTCIQANAFSKQGTENATKIPHFLQSSVELKPILNSIEDDICDFQMVPSSTIMLVESRGSFESSELHFSLGKCRGKDLVQ